MKLIAASGAVLGGCLGALCLPRVLPASLLLATFAAALCLVCLPRWRWFGWFVLGFAYTGVVVAGRTGLHIAEPAQQRYTETLVTGEITGLVDHGEAYLRFRLHTDAEPTRLLRLDWYRRPADKAPRSGERWQLRVRLRPPRGLANPGQPRFERYALREALAGTGYVVKSEKNRRLDGPAYLCLDCWRARLSRRIDALPGTAAARALVASLAIADRRQVSEQQWQVLRRTGLSHLMAISGLHIGMVALVAYWATTLVAAGMSRRAVPIGCCSALLAASVYAALAGFPVATRRALVVVVLLLVARWCRRSVHPANQLAVALLVVLVLDPLAPLERGFWMSFLAVAVLLYAARSWAQSKLVGALRAQLAVCAGLAPLSLLYFGEVSLLAPVLNLVAIPIAGLLVVPCILAGLVLLGLTGTDALLRLATAIIGSGWPLLERIADLEFSAWQPGTPSIAAALVATTGVAWLLAPPGWPARWFGLVMLLPLCLSRPDGPADGEFDAHILDVGHGLATVVTTARRELIYDTGPAWPGGANAAQRILLPFLQRLRRGTPELVVVSHGDIDHAGGLDRVRRRFPDTPLIGGAGAAADPCVVPMHWTWSGVRIEIIHPHRQGRWQGNNASCVVRISSPAGCLLLTGDVEAAAERHLLNTALPRCDVVVAAHHGSATSSTAGLVDALRPSVVIYSAGYRNRWNFPRPEVLSRWRALGAKQYVTGMHGAVTVRFRSNQEPQVTTERCDIPRLWSPPCAQRHL